MATRKRTAVAENGVNSEPQPVKSTTDDSMKRERRLRKELVQSRDRCYNTIRWTIVALSLLLLALGLFYYFTRTHHSPQGEEQRDRETERAAKNTNTKEAGGKPRKSGKTGDKPSKKKSKAGESGRQESGKPAKKKTQKSSKKSAKPGRRVETIAMEDVRLLRRPVSVDDADRPYIIEILNGDNLLLEERFSEALEKFNEVLKMFPQSPRALFGKAESLVGLATVKNSNKLLETAVEFFQDTANSFLAPEHIKVAALVRLAELNQRRGRHTAAITALETLHSLDSGDTVVANRLGAAYVAAGKYERADAHFKKLLNETPDNAYAKAHLGYLLFREREFEAALPLLMEGLRHDSSIQGNGRFYLYAGEALTRLNRSDEAEVLYSEAVSRDLFPSLYQRSLFNEPDLLAQPWWSLEETGYLTHLQPILDSIPNITNEIIPALLGRAQPPPKVWPLYSHGKRNAENCLKTPLTCSLVERVSVATSCKHGGTKFLVVPPNSHIPPHTGQTNTRLVVMMGLSLGEGEIVIRIADEKRTLKEGEVIVFDDSFEQEVWFSSLRPGLVLSMDVWHPDLSSDRRKRLSPIY